MDTTQAFGISAASGKSNVLSGSAQFIQNVETTTSVSDGNYVIFEINGGGIPNTGLTGIDWRNASTAGYIQNAQKIKDMILFASTNAATTKNYELYMLTCSDSTYLGATTIDYTASVTIDTITVGSNGSFSLNKISLPGGFVQASKGDLVNFALKNVSGGTVGGMFAQLIVNFENTL